MHPLCHDAFFPGAAPLSIELAHDPRDGRVLAADAWGTEGVDKRIDVLATAIAGNLGVADLAGLDLAYEPAFSAARDPVNVAGRRCARGIASARALLVCRRRLPRVRPSSSSTCALRASVRSRAASPARGGSRSPRSAPVQVELAKSNGPVVFVSSDGRAGFLAARLARARGLRDAAFLSGGLRSWVAAGLPLESTATRAKPKPKPKSTAKKTTARTKKAASPRRA